MQESSKSVTPDDESSRIEPSESTVGEVTQLFTCWDAADPADREKLFSLIYPELKRVAEYRMKAERPDHTLEAAALVNEFFVRLSTVSKQSYQNRLHFLAVASRAMHRILVDYARSHKSEKRGGQLRRVEIEEGNIQEPRDIQDILEVDELLENLAKEDQRMAEIVKLRYFGGLSSGEVAAILGVGERTVQRDWQVARAWLYTRIHRRKGDGA